MRNHDMVKNLRTTHLSASGFYTALKFLLLLFST
jgi:hypothetical protein